MLNPHNLVLLIVTKDIRSDAHIISNNLCDTNEGLSCVRYCTGQEQRNVGQEVIIIVHHYHEVEA